MSKFIKSPESIALIMAVALIALIGITVYVSEVENHSARIDGSHLSFEDELDQAMPHVEPVAFGSAATDLRAEYAADYRRGREKKLRKVHYCEACGLTAEELAKTEHGHLETHHVISVLVILTKGLSTSLIGDENNLIVLCRGSGSNECHFHFGHRGPDGKSDWSDSDPNVRVAAATNLKKMKSRSHSKRTVAP